jgi:hypothetical protein
MATLEGMRAKYSAKIPQMAANYDAAKGRAVANYRGPEGVSIGPQTRAAYEAGISRARFSVPANAAEKMVSNYRERMSR